MNVITNNSPEKMGEKTEKRKNKKGLGDSEIEGSKCSIIAGDR
jgi:hypothetical protein